MPITTQQILAHRAAQKAAGLAGCITGCPVPEMRLFGYSDVQSWRPADPMKPHCFCFDCRGLWDTDASIDLQLLQQAHVGATRAYAELLPQEAPISVQVPRCRDTRTEGFKGELSSFRSEILSQLILVMDQHRLIHSPDEEARAELMAKERILWAKLEAVELLLKA